MLKIYYSIENGGDGSAYPVWFTTMRLAERHQDHMIDGWGESCVGWITIEGDNVEVRVEDQYGKVAMDAETYRKELKSRLWGDKDSNEEGFTMYNEFVEEFFKDET